MIDLNVTYASLNLKSPLIAECVGRFPTAAVLRELTTAGAGAIMAPPLTSALLETEKSGEEITEHNDSDAARRGSRRLIRRLNMQEYLEEIHEMVNRAEVPVIAPLHDLTGMEWRRMAARCRDAGALAVELRPGNSDSFIVTRSQHIEGDIIRTTGSVAEQLDFPVITRIEVTPYGMLPLVRALRETGARGIVLASTALPESAPKATDLIVMNGVRQLYQSVAPYLSCVISGSSPTDLTRVIHLGTTVAILRIPEPRRPGSSAVVAPLLQELQNDLSKRSAKTLRDVRGIAAAPGPADGN
jgi:hypothetical protein